MATTGWTEEESKENEGKENEERELLIRKEEEKKRKGLWNEEKVEIKKKRKMSTVLKLEQRFQNGDEEKIVDD